MEMKALRFIVADLGSVPGIPACIPVPRMDFALEKHLPGRLFMINEVGFSYIFCPLACSCCHTKSRGLQLLNSDLLEKSRKRWKQTLILLLERVF